MQNMFPGVDTIVYTGGQSSWSAARDAVTGSGNVPGGSTGSARARTTPSGQTFRTFMAFDTSAITKVPDSASLKLHGHNSAATSIIVVKVDASATGDSSTNFVNSDFQKIVGFSAGNSMQGNVTDYSSALAMGSWDHNAHNEIALNAAARLDMKNLDEFKLVIISYAYDYLNVSPGAHKTTNFRSIEQGGAERPYLSYVEGTGQGGGNRRARRRG